MNEFWAFTRNGICHSAETPGENQSHATARTNDAFLNNTFPAQEYDLY